MAVGFGCGDSGYNGQFGDLRRGIWGDHVLRVCGVGAAFGQDAYGNDGCHFSSADRYGLFGQGLKHDGGVGFFAGASRWDSREDQGPEWTLEKHG